MKDYSQPAKAVHTDLLSLFELMYFNNPQSLIKSIRLNKLTTKVSLSEAEIQSIITRLIKSKDEHTLRNIITEFQFDNTKNNFTTDPEFWKALGNTPQGRIDIIFDGLHSGERQGISKGDCLARGGRWVYFNGGYVCSLTTNL